MLIHPWDAPQDDAEWQGWLARHDFGQLAVNGPAGEPPFVQPVHFAYDAERAEVVTHLARPNPVVKAIEAAPQVLLSVVDDYAFVHGAWKAEEGVPAEHGVPTSFYAAVQLRCTAHVVDDPGEKAALLTRQMAHFQGADTHAPIEPGTEPFGRLLAGIRGLRLEVTGVRAKFKYAGKNSRYVQERVAAGLAERGAPLDAAARAQLVRRMDASA
ncbi:FMN-binding negative transcriptional regulator [Streptomyces sp. NPDC051940]|uniref:FMN-binding negative transcriptional regulator n=1 Tax=Streptomyces sp. NPDC051940 TaxID=3155675 RepID=UPI003419111A